jgi:hypothetical protein
MSLPIDAKTLIERFDSAASRHKDLILQCGPEGQLVLFGSSDGCSEWNSCCVLAEKCLAEQFGIVLRPMLDNQSAGEVRRWVDGLSAPLSFAQWLVPQMPLVCDPFAPLPEYDRLQDNPFRAASLALSFLLTSNESSTIWYLGESSFQANGFPAMVITGDEQKMLLAFLDSELRLATNSLTVGQHSISNPSATFSRLLKRPGFAPAMSGPKEKNGGYHISVRSKRKN